MPRMYSEEEKQAHLDKFRVSGKSKTLYARENDIPEATFRAWVKEEQYAMYGALEWGQNSETNTTNTNIIRPILFCNENIRIELREGYDKNFLKQIIEVISNDK